MKHVATVLQPDPFDEREGMYISNADRKVLANLPPGTKLFVEDEPIYYNVVKCRVTSDFDLTYEWLGDEFSSRHEAILYGLKECESDDFNIAVIKGGTLVSLDWMYKPVDVSPETLSVVASELGIT